MKSKEIEEVKKRGISEALLKEVGHKLFSARNYLDEASKNYYEAFEPCITDARNVIDDAEQLMKAFREIE